MKKWTLRLSVTLLLLLLTLVYTVCGTTMGLTPAPDSYTHLRAHETESYLLWRGRLEKK